MNDTQLELGFGRSLQPRTLSPRQRRLSRANWWFERMRQVADRAFDWQPAPPAPPEQAWLAPVQRATEPGREDAGAAPASPHECQQLQTCE